MHPLRFTSSVLRCPRKSTIVNRPFSAKPSISLKKIVMPLIKRIHPDSCATESAEIQKANLICLQTLNEMCDKLSSVETSVSNKAETVSVVKPLTAAYPLSFYCKAGDGASEGGSMKRLAIVVSVPRELTSAHNISLINGRKALRALYLSIFGVLRAAGVQSISDSLDIPPDDGGQKSKSPTENDYKININVTEDTLREVDFDKKMFDRMTNVVKYGSNPGLLFSIPDRKTQRVPRAMISLVDKYVHGGNVLVKDLSPTEELTAVDRMRQFLIDYSEVLNFHPGSWRKVFFILNSRRSDYRRRSEVGGEFLFVPANFKHRALLEFLRVNLSLLMKQSSDPIAAAGINEEDFDEMELF